MTLEGFLDACVQMGLDGVELTQYYFADESPAALNTVKRQAYLRGLEVTGTAVGGNFSQDDPEGRGCQIEHVQDWLRKSMRLGSACLRVFAGSQPEGVDRATAEGWVRNAIEECLPVAEECGVIIAVETHGGLTSDADGILALVTPFADCPWVGVNLDFGNLAGDAYTQYARLAPHTVTTHAKTVLARTETKERVDYRRVVRLMREAGYRGPLSIEYEAKEDPTTGVPRFAAYLRGCLVDA